MHWGAEGTGTRGHGGTQGEDGGTGARSVTLVLKVMFIYEAFDTESATLKTTQLAMSKNGSATFDRKAA